MMCIHKSHLNVTGITYFFIIIVANTNYLKISFLTFLREKNRVLQIGPKEQHRHMSPHVLITLILTLTAYASFFHDIL
jgi:hypothetical protein